MAVMARETWTDHRLDDLNMKVDDGFKDMREELRALRGGTTGEFQAVRGEMKAEFQAVRGEMKAEFQAVRAEIKGELQAVRAEIKSESQAVRGEIKSESQAVRGEIQGVREEIAALGRHISQLTFGLIGTMLVGFLGTIVALVTQT